MVRNGVTTIESRVLYSKIEHAVRQFVKTYLDAKEREKHNDIM